MTEKEFHNFQTKILAWYAGHQRDLPWRKSRDPYCILVSEVMLQQTQVNRVIPKFAQWFAAFPTVHDLAKAKVSDVLALWSGLGYNRRALNLKKTAEIVSQQYNGQFPQTEKELLALPGIGEYTARALLCFAFGKQVPVVDTNVRKVILLKFMDSRLRGNDKISDKDIAEVAEKILPQGRAYEWNQALMDYASAMLKEHKIPIPKQSKFIGSRRYYRGQILKKLLEKKEIQLKELGKLLKHDYSENEYEWLHGLVWELRDEGFVEIHKEKLKLSS